MKLNQKKKKNWKIHKYVENKQSIPEQPIGKKNSQKGKLENFFIENKNAT